LYFQIHQPRRLKNFHFFDIGSNGSYFDDELNKDILARVARNCYLPMNKLLLRLIKKYPQIRITFSITGVALDQLQKHASAVVDSFRALAATGAVEFLGETYYHSLSFLINRTEFATQIEKHREKIIELFGIQPVTFRNTELAYSDAIGTVVCDLGFKGIYLDGIDSILHGRSPNYLYKHPLSDLVLIPRNYRLSDDIAFRYADKNWVSWPLTAKTFVSWLKSIPNEENFICLGIDYETFGEHQMAQDGIFEFMEDVISSVAKLKQFGFATPTEAIKFLPATDAISTTKVISWADQARDLSAWVGNDMQRDAFDTLMKLYPKVMNTSNEAFINTYRHLQTSDHFYYMSTKKDEDGDVHQYFSPYSSPYEAFMNYMNVLADVELRIRNLQAKLNQKTKLERRSRPDINLLLKRKGLVK